MVVQHNLSAMNANRYLGINNSKLSKSLEKLSSGYAINRAGDNAAGLAVSEKMRSQIAGMTQAVKNAQDGISMVQTFEGALTETDSILQRMKTLADQMANGTYDDPVDRTAAQQEFLQLNDELDQIADTDFNGVVVLNGGTMSDGLKAVNGEFNYKNAASAAASDPVDVGAVDDKTVEDVKYNKTVADAVWKDAKIDSKVTTAEITFTYDGSKWVGSAVVDKDTGKIVDGADASKLTTAAPTAANKGKGGFVLKEGGAEMAVVFDEMNIANAGRAAQKGDMITLEFTNTADEAYAPNNSGIKEGSVDPDTAVAEAKPQPKFTLDASIKDDITAEMNEALEALKNTTLSVVYDSGDVKTGDDGLASDNTDITVKNTGAGKFEISHANGTKLGTVEIDTTAVQTEGGIKTTPASVKVGTTDITLDSTPTATAAKTLNGAADGKWYDGAAEFTDWASLGLNAAPAGSAPGETLTFTPETTANVTAGKDTAATGEYKFQIDVAANKVAGDDPVTVKTTTTSEVAKAAAGGVEVSKSNAFKNSEAIMTYKESIILQAGARTKDAVEFTFKYDSKAIGDLEADLNCTAKGLGTADLNLSSQEAANYAIDKIDQAINKVSLVRGTFGAIQNRLEHKIDNLNVSVENLTSAESQIRDTNMPQEMMNFTKQQILAQASQSMLAQANQLPQGVLSLLQ